MSPMNLKVLSSLGNLFFGSILCSCVVLSFLILNSSLKNTKNEDKDDIFHCIGLFLDFITVFRKLMMTPAMNEKDKKKEKKLNDHLAFSNMAFFPSIPQFLTGGVFFNNEKHQKIIV